MIAAFWGMAGLANTSHAAGPAYTGKPYGGKPQQVPGIIQAEWHDVAPGNANGVAYNRRGTPKPGSARATGDCIGLGAIGADHVSTAGAKEKDGGAYVGWTNVGDWWKYTVEVKEAGTYNFGVKCAAGNKGAMLTATLEPLENAGAAASTGPLEIPTTAGFQPAVEVYHVWETLDPFGEVKLVPGLYVLTVHLDGQAGVNFDSFTLTKK
ncbi:carbohydrate-binding protein [Luteolibacter sp.]|uniref:carbohydrate-binding protein n=1 Tax=Luteolibacter sp. TaxID=1962973 RepID=UPI0032637A87